jgi:exonuclease SbcD
MRLLHTSDWHIGKKFEEVDLLPVQAEFCDWIIDVVTREAIDVVLLAGDLFDRATPKAEAVDLVDDVLNRLKSAGVATVAISGNHDSAERLNFGARFMAEADLHIRAERPNLMEIGQPVTITRPSGETVQILPLPYVDPQRVRMPDGMARRHDTALEAVIAEQRSRLVDPARTIVMGHAFVIGGIESDSERPLTIGGTGAIPAHLFDGFGYVALGHLHRPQTVGEEHIVYSGSPMSYSFSEEHAKSVRIVTVADSITSEIIPVEVGRPVVTITDTLENLLTSSAYAKHQDSFVRARLTDPTMQLGIMDRLRERFPHVLNAEQTALTRQGRMTVEEMRASARQTPDQIIDRYIDETFDDLDDFQKSFVTDTVATALRSDD